MPSPRPGAATPVRAPAERSVLCLRSGAFGTVLSCIAIIIGTTSRLTEYQPRLLSAFAALFDGEVRLRHDPEPLVDRPHVAAHRLQARPEPERAENAGRAADDH